MDEKRSGMISFQVPTSLCMQNKLIMQCFVEQYEHPRESIYTWLICTYGMNKNGLPFLSLLSLPPLSPSSLSLLSLFFAHTIAPFCPGFPLSILSSCLFFQLPLGFFWCYNLKLLAACLELRPTVNLWITCPCSLPLS